MNHRQHTIQGPFRGTRIAKRRITLKFIILALSIIILIACLFYAPITEKVLQILSRPKFTSVYWEGVFYG